MEPLVSILVPVYNSERWLADTLRSALNQTWARKEIIVVDDGSTDQSSAIAKGFESSTLKLISQKRSGAATARNVALAQAQGQLIQYLDSDDLLDPSKIELQVRCLLAETPGAVATSAWTRFYDSPDTAQFVDKTEFRSYSDPVDWLFHVWSGLGTMPPLSWLLPRPVVDKAGKWNESLSLSDDTEYFTRIVLNSSKIAFCSNALSYYRSGNPSLSSRRDRSSLESYFLVCRLCTEELLAFEDSSRTRRACANLWQFFAYHTYPEAADLVRRAEYKARQLGGTELRLNGSLAFNLVSKVGGWKTAKRLQRIYYNQRHLDQI